MEATVFFGLITAPVENLLTIGIAIGVAIGFLASLIIDYLNSN